MTSHITIPIGNELFFLSNQNHKNYHTYFLLGLAAAELDPAAALVDRRCLSW